MLFRLTKKQRTMKMKTFYYATLTALFFAVLIFTVSSCNKEDDNDNEPDDDEVSISENTEVIQQSDWNNAIQSVDTTDYTFTFSDEIQNTNEINEGDIMVSSEGEGYLRRVTRVVEENGEVTVETEFVGLDEVVENGGFSFEEQLTQNKIKKVNYYKKGVKVDTSFAKSPEEEDINYQIDTYLGPGDNIHLSGLFSLQPNVFMEYNISWFSLDYLEFGAGVEEQLEVAANIDLVDVEDEHEVPLAGIDFNSFIVQVGTVPVVITPSIELNAGIGYDLESSVWSEVNQQLSYENGIVYDGEWSTYSDLNKSFTYSPPQLEATAKARVYIKPEFLLKIYGTISPKLFGELYDRIEADINATPWWSMYAGAEFGAGINVSILTGELYDQEWTFDDLAYEELVVDAGSIENQSPEIPTIVQPNNSAQNQPTSLTLEWSCEDPDGDPLTYDVYFGQSDSPSLVAEDIENTEYEVSGLDYNTTYHWQIKAHDDHGNTSESPVWSFTTFDENANQPPETPELLSPDNNATDVSQTPTLEWECEDPENDPLTYDIYLGQSENDLTIVESNYDQTNFTTSELDANTNYYWKIVAADDHGNTSESDVYSFTTESGGGTPPTGYFTDPRDGQEYAFIEIGDQTWMAENLNYETENSWWYDNDPDNGDTYGRLYTWEAALDACPDGWHLPSDEEWKSLEMELGMSQNEADGTSFRGTNQGEQMKSASGWHTNDGHGTNSSGFNGFPGGILIRNGGQFKFDDLFHNGVWWSSTSYSEWRAWLRRLYFGKNQISRTYTFKAEGFSVRCLKN